ncbi:MULTISPECIES: acyl carrier protein [unclassified Streptomyces]|uniref:acyl carrier protein n=1 Tax=unclassified Streptomyces TaxID=2593676 RepID=UPI00365F3E8F
MNSNLIRILHTGLNVTQESLQPDATLADLGFDSLALVELSMLLKEQAQIDISDTDLHQAGTLGAINGLVEQKLAEQ